MMKVLGGNKGEFRLRLKGKAAVFINFLANQGKQVIVVFEEGHLGREISKLGRKVFLCSIKNIPPISRGA